MLPDTPDTADSSKQSADNTQKMPRGKAFSWRRRILTALLVLPLLLAAAGVFLFQSGLGGDYLDDKVQAALQKKIGRFARADINNARLSLDDDYHIALEIKNTPVDPHDDNIVLSPIGRLRFGFAAMPLLRRKAEVIQIEADNASLTVHKQSSGKGLLSALPHDGKQRVDFDALADMAFSLTEELTAKADKIKINTFRCSNISVSIQSPQERQNFTVKQFQLRRLRKSAELKARIVWLGQEISITGSAALDTRGKVQSFTLSAANIPVRLGAADDAKPYLVNGRPNNGFFRLRGLADIVLSGEKTDSAGSAASGKKITFALDVKQARSDISVDAGIPAALKLSASYLRGSGQIEARDSLFTLGGLELPFSGRFGYDERQGEDGLYHFALSGKGASSSPADSPAEPLSFDLNISGAADSLNGKINLSELALTAEESALYGQGSIRFGAQSWPEIIFVLRSAQMPADAAKQLWPINIARPARAWVLSHIFGGDLKNVQIEIALPEGFYQKGKLPPLLTAKQLRISADIDNTRSDLVGALPPLRDAGGSVGLEGTNTAVRLNKALAYVDDGRIIRASDGLMSFVWRPGKPLWADLSVHLSGGIGAVGRLLACKPVNAADKVPFNMQTAKGDINALLKLNFPLYRGGAGQGGGKRASAPAARKIDWTAQVGFKNFTLAEPYRGAVAVAGANGTAELNSRSAAISGDALINGVPATVSLVYPLAAVEKKTAGESEAAGGQERAADQASAAPPVQKEENITFHLDDRLRNKLFPGLSALLKGPINAQVGASGAGGRAVKADLTNAAVQIPWAGWRKGAGIPAIAVMTLPMNEKGLKNIDIDDFVLSGANFRIAGKLHIRDGSFAAAEFSQFALNRGDRLALTVARSGKTYHIKLNGAAFDMRAFIKSLSSASAQTDAAGGSGSIALTAAIDRVRGFYGETLSNFRAVYNRSAAGDSAGVNAVSPSGKPLIMAASKQKGLQEIKAQAEDAGSFLRFMNYYDKMRGGTLQTHLQTAGPNILAGPVTIRAFTILNEPKLQALTAPQKTADGKKSSGPLTVDWAHGQITKGANYLTLSKGVIRGPSVGATFQGTIYDSIGNIAMTGTYMPVYSLNRVFGDVPVLGTILGNGRDKGLIGITFKIEGKLSAPKVVVNPISAIAPGVLRSMFEFRRQP